MTNPTTYTDGIIRSHDDQSSVRPMNPDDESSNDPSSTDDFEAFVAALLKVDPTGLSGKHHKPLSTAPDRTNDEGPTT